MDHLRNIEEQVDSLIPDAWRCPITGRVMQDPVIADDGISYERAALQAWLDGHGNRLPVSGIPKSSQFILNRALRDMTAGVEAGIPGADVITRLRLAATLHWMTKSKFEIPDDFLRHLRTPLSAFDGGWPLITDPKSCASLAWEVFPRLRLIIYVQFACVSGTSYITDAVKSIAKECFVDALASSHITKTAQLMHALDLYVSRHPDLRPQLEAYKGSITCREWCAFWNEPAVQRPVSRDEYYHDLSQPHGQGAHDFSRDAYSQDRSRSRW